ncbi:MAG TPA: PilZ domain-containing protein [Allosphingosinicella sp.]|jgi:hypothetical protein
MKELPKPRPGHRWEPVLVAIDAAPADGAEPPPAPALPAPDRRAHVRVATIMRTGTLRAPAGRAPCIVKDISPGGALVASRLAPAPGEAVSLRIKSGGEARGRVVRTGGELVAIRFDAEMDLCRLLDARRLFGRARAKLPPVETCRPATLDDGDGPAPVTLIRISQGNARVAGFAQAPAAATLTLCLDGLPPIAARVTRVADDRLHLAFRRRLAYGALATWLAAPGGVSPDEPANCRPFQP